MPLLLVLSALPAGAGGGAAEVRVPLGDPLDGIAVLRDEIHDAIRYEPEHDPWEPYEFRLYPTMTVEGDGRRSIDLHAELKGTEPVGLRSLRILLDGKRRTLRFWKGDRELDESGCLSREASISLSQNKVAHQLAASRDVEIRFRGKKGSRTYHLGEKELRYFKQIVAMYDMEVLPEKANKYEITKAVDAASLMGMPGFEEPQLIEETKIDPQFPALARARGKWGRVVVMAIIARDGTIREARIHKSETLDCGFEKAALEAVKKWRYVPGKLRGEPLNLYLTILFTFRP